MVEGLAKWQERGGFTNMDSAWFSYLIVLWIQFELAM